MKLLKKIKCPKCRNKKIILKEWATIHQEYIIDNNQVIDFIEHELLGMPDIINVTGECQNCKHEWTLRNVIQITDVIDIE